MYPRTQLRRFLRHDLGRLRAACLFRELPCLSEGRSALRRRRRSSAIWPPAGMRRRARAPRQSRQRCRPLGHPCRRKSSESRPAAPPRHGREALHAKRWSARRMKRMSWSRRTAWRSIASSWPGCPHDPTHSHRPARSSAARPAPRHRACRLSCEYGQRSPDLRRRTQHSRIADLALRARNHREYPRGLCASGACGSIEMRTRNPLPGPISRQLRRPRAPPSARRCSPDRPRRAFAIGY